MIKLKNEKIYSDEVKEVVKQYNETTSNTEEDLSESVIECCETLINNIDNMCNTAVKMDDDLIQSHLMLTLSLCGILCEVVTHNYCTHQIKDKIEDLLNNILNEL